ncbi:MAG: LacI family DNA-binding transcriptional regulator [Vreelandella alkaliphila]|uniref:LacI family DNA-binding transcriptional regulator n=1 Tax=Halomonadaceae TaxID=28256 RepID=UPI000E881F04|nr:MULTISPECIES: LacI family DNA-binding transcriptional regulator [unclassified Halomonas]WKD29319.1 LacI family transcriptional regulator [Halomonas sp. KG2]HBP40386.1 LacI family transcriptional regulator [Halomonas sp.]HBS82647.1 LacI family transcriptional regulator [Halomonas campaniensis]
MKQTKQSAQTATIREIARRADVSIASVSRALNGKPGLSDALREKILTISREVAYQPSAAARQLISGKAAVVGISLGRQDIELRPYYILLYQHLTVALHQQGMVPIFFHHDQTAELPERAGAAILLGETSEDERPSLLENAGVPFVRIGNPGQGFSVAPDDAQGVYEMTHHLIAQGRRQLAFVGGELEMPGPHSRLEGYRRALDEAELSEQLISLPHRFSSDSLTSYRYLNRLLAETTNGQAPPFDALVCATDELALGCVAALEDRGIDVPRQVAVTGFDDLPALASGLTTIRQDIAAIAAMSVELLGEALASKAPRHVSLPVTLVMRETG